MIQQQTRVDIADNTGAKTAMCIKVLGGSSARGKFTRKVAGVGDLIIVAVKTATPNGDVKLHDVARAVIVRTKKTIHRDSGMCIRFDDNAAVIVNKDGNPRGTRVFGPVARELRDKNYLKIVSLAPEVL